MSEFVVIRSWTIYHMCKSLYYGQLADYGNAWLIFVMNPFFSSFIIFNSSFDGFYNFFNRSNSLHCFFKAFLFKWFKILMSNLAGFLVIPYWSNASTIYSSIKISTSFFSLGFFFGFHPNLNIKFFIASGSYSFFNVTNDDVGSLLASFLPCWFWIKGRCKNLGTVAPNTL